MNNRNNKLSRITYKKKKKRRLRKIFYILIPLLLIVGAGTAYGMQLYGKASNVIDEAYEDDGKEKSDLREEKVDPDIHNVSILLLGIDENDIRKQNEVARADAIMVATLNKEDKSVKLLSIPRDSRVYIPEVNYDDKINHAYAFGEMSKGYNVTGTSAMVETVENLLEIPIDYYIKLNFNAFIAIIDALGGIAVDVPYTISELNSQDDKNGIYLEEGFQTLNGEEALALARTRKLDSDFERGKRQMEIIDAMMNKSMSVSSILKYGDMIDSLEGNMSTNMKPENIKSFFS